MIGRQAVLLVLASLLLPHALAQTDQAEETDAESESWGLNKEQPVEVCEPQGQRQYLARLICPGGQHPLFERTGNVGPRHPLPDATTEEEAAALIAAVRAKSGVQPGATDHHWIDAYDVSCSDAKMIIYMDMYHCDLPIPAAAPVGFTIRD